MWYIEIGEFFTESKIKLDHMFVVNLLVPPSNIGILLIHDYCQIIHPITLYGVLLLSNSEIFLLHCDKSILKYIATNKIIYYKNNKNQICLIEKCPYLWDK